MAGFVEAMAEHEKKSRGEIEKEFFEHVRPSSLLKRFATVDEVAAMATYVASELSSATNGTASGWRCCEGDSMSTNPNESVTVC